MSTPRNASERLANLSYSDKDLNWLQGINDKYLRFRSTKQLEDMAIKKLAKTIERASGIPPMLITPSMRDDYVQLAKEILARKKREFLGQKTVF